MAKPSWISLSKSSGTGEGSVNVTASSNGTSLRSGSITIGTESGLTKSVSVSQKAAELAIDLYPYRKVNGAIGFFFQVRRGGYTPSSELNYQLMMTSKGGYWGPNTFRFPTSQGSGWIDTSSTLSDITNIQFMSPNQEGYEVVLNKSQIRLSCSNFRRASGVAGSGYITCNCTVTNLSVSGSDYSYVMTPASVSLGSAAPNETFRTITKSPQKSISMTSLKEYTGAFYCQVRGSEATLSSDDYLFEASYAGETIISVP